MAANDIKPQRMAVYGKKKSNAGSRRRKRRADDFELGVGWLSEGFGRLAIDNDNNATSQKEEENATQQQKQQQQQSQRQPLSNVSVNSRSSRDSTKPKQEEPELGPPSCGQAAPRQQDQQQSQQRHQHQQSHQRQLHQRATNPTISTDLAQHLKPLKDLARHLKPLLALNCVPTTITDFQSYIDAFPLTYQFQKIGEGSEAEIYQISISTVPSSTSSATSANRRRILKILPLRMPSGQKNSRSKTKIADAASEVALMNEMDGIDGFVVFHEARVVTGAFPEKLAVEWNKYRDEAAGQHDEQQQNLDPTDVQKNFPLNQLWLLVEMGDAGTAVETFIRRAWRVENGLAPKPSMVEVWDVFWSVATALARAEQANEFEHRDLHLGNACVKNAADGRRIKTTLTDEDVRNKTTGFTKLEVTIIDYTLSRGIVGGKVLHHQFKENDYLFRHWQTVATRDPSYGQFKTYDLMRDVVNHRDVCQEGWEGFYSLTNVLWLGYLLKVLLSASAASTNEVEMKMKKVLNITSERMRKAKDGRQKAVKDGGLESATAVMVSRAV